MVFVIDREFKPLLPTTEARARLLLKKKKAFVYSVIPFTIQLKKVINNPVGKFKIGIDDGAKEVGISIGHKKNVVFCGTIKLRQDVHRKMLQRMMYRRNRRNRNLRYRQCRFLNRKREKGWIPPSIRQKKESILRVIDFMMKRLNITKCVVEQGQFDISSMSAGYKLVGKEYQQSRYEGENWRQKVLWRDKYICQHCKSKENLNAHHIIPRSNGGTNIVKNGLTLCKNCHNSLHNGKWLFNKSVKQFRYPAHVQQGKWFLFNALKERFKKVRICFGWMTKNKRIELGLKKSHANDASAMIKSFKFKCKEYLIIPKRTKVWENNPTKTCIERNGFRHWDIIKAKHYKLGNIVGSIRSLKVLGITIRTNIDSNFPISYSKSKLIWRPRRLIFI